MLNSLFPRFRSGMLIKTVMMLCVVGVSAYAQTPNDLIINTQRPYFDLDYAGFATTNPDTSRLELYLQIRNNELHFVRKGDLFQAQSDITIVLENMSTGFSTGTYHRQTFYAMNFDEVISRSKAAVVQLDFELPAGQYRAMTTVTDFESDRTVSRKLVLNLPRYMQHELNISLIQLCNRITPSKNQADAKRDFVKGNDIVIPRPNREFGQKDDELGIYFEVYGMKCNEAQQESLLLQYTIMNREGKINSENIYQVNKPGPTAAIKLNPSIEDLPSGRYDLTVSILDKATGRQANRRTSFFRWSHQNIQAMDAARTPLEAMKFIAEPSELTQLRRTPSNELDQAMRDFWRSKDPTPETKENEALSHFNYLVSSANNAFGFKKMPGWQTDQGKTFIWNGMPDMIYRSHNSDDSAQVEVWVYRSVGERFIFIDQNGSGHFRLFNPEDVAVTQNL